MRKLTYSKPLPRKVRKPKGVTAKYRAKRKRKDDAVAGVVRADVDERDGYCRIGMSRSGDQAMMSPGDAIVIGLYQDAWGGKCAGSSEWCHMHVKRRSQTRNQAPEVRHTTAHSFKGCQFHHDCYDGRQSPRLFVTALTSKGADGPLKFRQAR